MSGFPNPIPAILIPSNPNNSPLNIGGAVGQATDLLDIYSGPGLQNKQVWVDPSGSLHDSQILFAAGLNIGSAGNTIAGAMSLLDYVTKTSAYTATNADLIIYADTTTAAFTITLPASPSSGAVLIIKQIANNTNFLTISGNGKNIDGAASITFTANNEGVVLHYNNNAGTWNVIAQVAASIL